MAQNDNIFGLAWSGAMTEERLLALIPHLRAFARAVRGTAPYPISGEEMINNIALLEAIIRSARSGVVEQL